MSAFELTKEIVVAMLNNKFINIKDGDYATSVASAYEVIYNKIEELRNK